MNPTLCSLVLLSLVRAYHHGRMNYTGSTASMNRGSFFSQTAESKLSISGRFVINHLVWYD